MGFRGTFFGGVGSEEMVIVVCGAEGGGVEREDFVGE
jgi:hypothetical protein